MIIPMLIYVERKNLKEGLCIPLRGNIPLGGNSLFATCYHDVGKKIVEND